MIPIICPPCAEAADMDIHLGVPPIHDPAICRDRHIQPHGCGCAHGQNGQPEPAPAPKTERRTLRIDSAIPATNGTPRR